MNDFRPPPIDQIRAIIQRALDEDIAWGDVTTDSAVPASAVGSATLLAKQSGVLCGVDVFAEALRMTDGRIRVEVLLADGTAIEPGAIAARATGPVRGLLTGERTALNLVQRMSGVATVTRQFAQALEDLPVRLVDTRKTTPGLRILEKYAVRVGGGQNHRYNLADAVLLKDNHLAALAQQGLDLTESIRAVKARVPHTMKVEVEVTRLDQIEAVIAGGADIVLLDNMTADQMREGVAIVAGRALTECSGGVNLGSVRAKALSGVDIISAGALTHSAPALDFSLELE